MSCHDLSLHFLYYFQKKQTRNIQLQNKRKKLFNLTLEEFEKNVQCRQVYVFKKSDKKFKTKETKTFVLALK